MKNRLRWIVPVFGGLIVLGILGKEYFKPNAQTIVVQPFNNFPKAQTQEVFKSLKEVYLDVSVKPAIPLPASAYYPIRSRYRADKLIAYLKKRHGADTVVIALTDKDISITKGKHADWGVMGFGYRPGTSCVISTYRIRNNKDQLPKLAFHELGHTQGLPHCPELTCFMRDAEGANPLNQMTGFCHECKTFLKSKGWNI